MNLLSNRYSDLSSCRLEYLESDMTTSHKVPLSRCSLYIIPGWLTFDLLILVDNIFDSILVIQGYVWLELSNGMSIVIRSIVVSDSM